MSNLDLSQKSINKTPISDASFNDVTAVIVTYFSADCIAVLAKSLIHLPNVIFVDNGSTDGTLTQIKTCVPQAKLIALEKNIGFGAANNRAFAICSTEFIAIINPDVTFDPEAINLLKVTAKKWPEAVFIAPQLLSRKGEIDRSYRWTRYGSTHKNGSAISKAGAAEGVICTGFCTGAFLLARSNLLKQLGGFDEDFFLYYEDEDLCQRAFDAGMPILLEPKAQVTHFSRGSVKTSSPLRSEYFRFKHHTYSKFLFDKKHNPSFSSHSHQSKLIKLWCLALMALPFRLIIPSKKYSIYLGRILGRLSGLYGLTFSKKP
jgi:N-acetylglucosaminyl-diphospho-decaprenol L-rhamnosyltransferase